MSSLEEHDLAHMMIKQEMDAMRDRLIASCDQCLVVNEEIKKADHDFSRGKASDLPHVLRNNWLVHLQSRHNL